MKQKQIYRFLLFLPAVTGMAQVTLNTVPSRVVGHAPTGTPEGLTPTNFNPNLVEGRELYGPTGLALDTSAQTPYLYVSDTANNRVLAWKNGLSFAAGQPADIVIGQPDFLTTTPGGPGTTFSTGLSSPTGLAVRNGDLYVADSGNNRVLRYPQPFANAGHEAPNLVIGQPTVSGSRTANYPSGKPTANGISLFPSGAAAAFTVGIAFDSSGNLWMSDPGNRRVLRFPSAAISPNPSYFPAADFVLGQSSPTDFTNLLPNLAPNITGAYTTTQFYVPSSVAFDAAGRLYVPDADPTFAVNRVLVFNMGNAINGVPQVTSVRILGLPPQPPANSNQPPPSQAILNQTLILDPAGVVLIPDPTAGQDVGVIDSGDSRILVFPPVEKWTTDPLVAPPAAQVIGQNGDFSNFNPNNAVRSTVNPPPTASTLAFPSAAVFLNSVLYIADTVNNRVVTLPYSAGSFGPASQVLGQGRMDTGSINYIEGREFSFISGDAGLAIDSTGSTPHLYVADTGNHRVLGFKDLRGLTAGSKADIVIGQPDFQTAVCNYNASSPTHGGDPSQPNQSSLCGPIGVVVDASGNLYVADSLNGRVLRFPAPFNYTGGALEPADLVLGQANFTSQVTDPSPATMARPYGLAFSGTNGLAVSDVKHNRVLYFPATNGAFTNGEAATKVFGQNLFNSVIAGTDQASLKQPHHLASDTNGNIYVADTANNRIQIFPDPNNPATAIRGGAAVFSLLDNLNSPHGVYVSPSTGEIWVTDTNNAQAKRYGRFPDQLLLSGASTAQIPAAAQTLAVTQDQFGDLLLADFSHRVAIYFPGLLTVNGGSFLVGKPLAPGMVASICAPGSNAGTPSGCITGAPVFGIATATASAQGFPLPLNLSDTQVLFNGKPAPLYYVSASQINFVMPNGQNPGDVQTTGFADLQVARVSTGQVLAAGSIPMAAAAPGILQQVYAGTQRQAAVLNQDNSPNSPTNAAARGSTIQIFATGAGFVPGAPPDGQSAQGPVNTANTPQVVIGSCLVDDTACTQEPPGNVKYSGLSQFPGVWQVNVRIPQNTAPGAQIPLFLGMNQVFSTDNSSGFRMVIAVK